MTLTNEIDVLSRLISDIKKTGNSLKPNITSKKIFLNDFRNYIKNVNKNIETEINHNINFNIKNNKDIVSTILKLDNKIKTLQEKMNEISKDNQSEHANGIPKTSNDKNKLSILLDKNFKMINNSLYDLTFFLKDELYDIKKSLVTLKNDNQKIKPKNKEKSIDEKSLFEKILSKIPKPSDSTMDTLKSLGLTAVTIGFVKILYDNRDAIMDYIKNYMSNKFDVKNMTSAMETDKINEIKLRDKKDRGNLKIEDRGEYITSQYKQDDTFMGKESFKKLDTKNIYNDKDKETIEYFLYMTHNHYRKYLVDEYMRGINKDKFKDKAKAKKEEILNEFKRAGSNSYVDRDVWERLMTILNQYESNEKFKEMLSNNLDKIYESLLKTMDIELINFNKLINSNSIDRGKLDSLNKNSSKNYQDSDKTKWNTEDGGYTPKSRIGSLFLDKDVLMGLTNKISEWINRFYFLGDDYKERLENLRKLYDVYMKDKSHVDEKDLNAIFDKMVEVYFKRLDDKYYEGVKTVNFDTESYYNEKSNKIDNDIALSKNRDNVISTVTRISEKVNTPYKMTDFTVGSVSINDIDSLNQARTLFSDFIKTFINKYNKLSKQDMKSFKLTINKEYLSILSQIKSIVLSNGETIGSTSIKIFVNFLVEIDDYYNQVMKDVKSSDDIPIVYPKVKDSSDTKYESDMENRIKLVSNSEETQNNAIMGTDSELVQPKSIWDMIKTGLKSLVSPKASNSNTTQQSMGADTKQVNDYKDVREFNIDGMKTASKTSSGKGVVNKNVNYILNKSNVVTKTNVSKDLDPKLTLRKITSNTVHNKRITRSRNFRGQIPEIL